MIYSIEDILEGIASVLAEKNLPIYTSARQQGVNTPCFFISMMPGSDKTEVDGRTFIDLGFDIVFLQDPNIVNAMDGIYSTLEFLQEYLQMIPYTQDDETIYLHTYERQHSIQDMDLHYQFHIKQRMRLDKSETLMAALEEINHEIKIKQ